MKKILGAALALSLIGSAAFAEITVSGRGYVETQVFNYSKANGFDEGTTSLFDNWDTGDSDVFISGDINGIAGAMLNIDFGSVANGWSVNPGSITPDANGTVSFGASWIGDWNVWIKEPRCQPLQRHHRQDRIQVGYAGNGRRL